MKQSKKNVALVSILTLLLTACGSSSSDDDKQDHDDDKDQEHAHNHSFAVLLSRSGTDTLSLLAAGELNVLEDSVAGNGASLVLGETGAYAATLASGTVNFVHGLHEEHEEEHSDDADEEHAEGPHVLDFSLTGSKVITTNNHFAVLDSGSTTFVAYDELENDTPTTESSSGLSVNETYPALILEEVHDLKLAFDGTDAVVYEGVSQEHSVTCATPTSHGQVGELVVVSCGANVIALVIEEDEVNNAHTFTDSTLTLDGTAANYIWRSQGDVIAGFEPSTKNYALITRNDNTGTVEVIKGSDSNAFVFEQNICDLVLDSYASDILTMGTNGIFTALNHGGEMLKTITLDESTSSACSDINLAAGSKTALVIDNNAQKGFMLDVHEPDTNPSAYHLHGRFNLSMTDVSDITIFHKKDGSAHSHDH